MSEIPDKLDPPGRNRILRRGLKWEPPGQGLPALHLPMSRVPGGAPVAAPFEFQATLHGQFLADMALKRRNQT